MSLRFRETLPVGAPAIRSLTLDDVGSRPRDKDRRGRMLGTKRVEAVVVSWYPAAGLRVDSAKLSLDVFKFEHQPHSVTQLNPTSAAGRGTRTGEDP